MTKLGQRVLLLLGAVLLAAGFSGADTPPAFGAMKSFRILNASPETMCYLYLSPRSQEVWSERPLGPGCLQPGAEWIVTIGDDQVFLWDMRLKDDQGNYHDYPPFDSRGVMKMTLLPKGLVKVN